MRLPRRDHTVSPKSIFHLLHFINYFLLLLRNSDEIFSENSKFKEIFDNKLSIRYLKVAVGPHERAIADSVDYCLKPRPQP